MRHPWLNTHNAAFGGLLAVLAVIVGLTVWAVATHEAPPPPPESGEVLDKRFVPAHWQGGYRSEPRISMRCDADGCLPRSETVQVWEPRHRWVDDAWALHLRNCDNRAETGSCHTGWRPVSRATHDEVVVGHHWPEPR